MFQQEEDNYPPLISPRSPSYERARYEFLHPTRFGDAGTVAALSRLSEAEHDAHRLCERLAPLLGETRAAGMVREHVSVHAARRQALAEMIEELGGSAPTPQESRVLLSAASDAAERASSAEQAREALTLMREELEAEYEAVLHGDDLNGLNPEQRAAVVGLMPGPRS